MLVGSSRMWRRVVTGRCSYLITPMRSQYVSHMRSEQRLYLHHASQFRGKVEKPEGSIQMISDIGVQRSHLLSGVRCVIWLRC
jgi:hypothetical protein